MTTPSAPGRSRLRFVLFGLLVVAIVSLPFVLFGEAYALPLLDRQGTRTWALVAVGIALLAADSIAPVPSVLVIMGVAAKAGWFPGFITGLAGLTGQVVFAALFGRAAVRPLAPRFFSSGERQRLHEALQRRLGLTLACMRSVPVLAETSVIIAASLGVSWAKLLGATVAPNVALALIYALAADDSFTTACIAFFATVVPSYLIWRVASRNP